MWRLPHVSMAHHLPVRLLEIAAATAASGSASLLGGLRWGLWSARAFAVLALVLVVVFMRHSSRRQPEI
ncbi:MAG TPA: hypothetical protein VKA82_02455 [Rubrobacter sp.]|nr:hypothetical protein [Rubrobacter sp.]